MSSSLEILEVSSSLEILEVSGLLLSLPLLELLFSNQLLLFLPTDTFLLLFLPLLLLLYLLGYIPFIYLHKFKGSVWFFPMRERIRNIISCPDAPLSEAVLRDILIMLPGPSNTKRVQRMLVFFWTVGRSLSLLLKALSPIFCPKCEADEEREKIVSMVLSDEDVEIFCEGMRDVEVEQEERKFFVLVLDARSQIGISLSMRGIVTISLLERYSS
ncbi:hypothetical protein BDZ91DRAFT_769010 [Kalaharituber pfeilii]|nr:hypothetical protein BDZ91DRAFT_769010 [Kalaharituber pfeilii]